jgi:hypothetical protein
MTVELTPCCPRSIHLPEIADDISVQDFSQEYVELVENLLESFSLEDEQSYSR